MTFDRVAWLEWKRGGWGASDIAAVVGLSPWSSLYAKWCNKVGLIGEEVESDAMAHGRYAEHAIKAWYEDHHDLRVGHSQRWCEHPDSPWARCTPDGALLEHPAQSFDDAPGLIEFKVADFRDWDDVPDHYRCQGMWQLFVTGKLSVTFAVQHGKRFAVYILERDEDDIAFLYEAGRAAWYDFVVAGVAPDVDAHHATTTALNHRWSAVDESSIDLDAEAVKALDDLRDAKREQAWWTERRALHENTVKAALGEASFGRADGKVAVTWKTSISERIDTKALRTAEPDVAKRFTTITESRRFLVKGPSE